MDAFHFEIERQSNKMIPEGLAGLFQATNLCLLLSPLFLIDTRNQIVALYPLVGIGLAANIDDYCFLRSSKLLDD
jgi:hypothetical protein